MLGLFRKRNKKDTSPELKKFIGDYELPSFSTTVMNVLDLLRDPDSSISDIANQIEIDPGLHVKVLTTVNSAAFGLATKVSNVAHAVSLLGRSRLESLVLSVAVKDALPDSSTPCFDGGHFWQVSMMRAVLARELAQRLHPSTVAESFSAGLLQDMAMPVMADVKGKQYCNILQEWDGDMGSDLCALEQKYLGITHASLGKMIAERWELPEYLVSAIGRHHDDQSDTMSAVKLVSLIRYRTDGDALLVFKRACMEATGMDGASVDEMVERAIRLGSGLES